MSVGELLDLLIEEQLRLIDFLNSQRVAGVVDAGDRAEGGEGRSGEDGGDAAGGGACEPPPL